MRLTCASRCLSSVWDRVDQLMPSALASAPSAQTRRASERGPSSPAESGRWLQALREENVPEIQRCHLAPSILQVKALGIDNIMTFPWLDAPPAEAAVRGLEQLYALGALNEHARCAQPNPTHPPSAYVTTSSAENAVRSMLDALSSIGG